MKVEVKAGYLADIEYTGEFYDHLAPAWLAYIAAINGFQAPQLDRGFTWCELGCGKGVTALMLAALYPASEFHACDLNPAHVEYARRLQQTADLGNLQFHAASFGNMIDADIPDFDFIVLHGVYSWVPEAARAEIQAFLRRKLKPGGLAMVSYNAMPGWAHLQPVRHVMQSFAAAAPGNSADKAKFAFARIDRLAREGAGYFAANPAAVAHLREIATQDIRYVAHEYLTPHGDPFHFRELAQAMQSAGLAYAGEMTPENNYLPLMAPRRFHDMLAQAPTRAELETQRDFIVNTRFRRDLYAGRSRQVGPERVSNLEAMTFCLVDLPERLSLEVNRGPLQFDLQGQARAIGAIHGLLAQGPATGTEIHAESGNPTVEETGFLIQQLVVSRHLAPCSPVRPDPGWMRVNAAIVETGLRDRLPRVALACPGTGSVFCCEILQAATIEALARGGGDVTAAAGEVLERVRRHRHPVNRLEDSGGTRAATDGEVLEFVTSAWRVLSDADTSGARFLRQAGILK